MAKRKIEDFLEPLDPWPSPFDRSESNVLHALAITGTGIGILAAIVWALS